MGLEQHARRRASRLAVSARRPSDRQSCRGLPNSRVVLVFFSVCFSALFRLLPASYLTGLFDVIVR